MVDRNSQQVGNYRLIQRLGGNEVAQVYLSEHVFLKTLAAVRILQAPLHEQDRAAYQREGDVLVGLAHRNIVRILEFGIEDETCFLAMEYISGETLRQRYPPGSRLSLADMISFIKPIASALQYAHAQNSIHGSVKPENILLDLNQEALLNDFGVTALLQIMHVQQLPASAYTAPEQAAGDLQPASDQYALAVIAYELLNGELPLHDTHSESKSNISDFSQEITEVLNIARQKDPARRFGSIQAFFSALEQACGVISVEDSVSKLTPVSVPPPLTPYEGYQSQDVTLANTYNAPFTEGASGVEIAPVLERAGPFSHKSASRRPSRRVVLAGIGGGIIIIGGAVFLATSGRLFAGSPAKQAYRPGPNARPPIIPTLPDQPTATTPVQDTPTSSPNTPIGTTLTTFTGQSSDVTGICWSPTPGSGLVASASQDGTASIWNATTGAVSRIFPKSGPRNTLVWSPNNQYLALTDGTTIGVWDGGGLNLISTCAGGHTLPVLGLAWSPDSQRIVSTSQDHTAIVWQANTGSQLLTFKGHSQYVWVAAWAPDGSTIATGSWDNTVQIWNPDTGAVTLSYTATKPVRAVDWSPDSSLIASGGDDNTIKVWQATNGNVQVTYSGHHDHIETVQWSHDGKSIASASKDATVQIWQSADATPIYTYTGHSQLVWSLAWSPDGQLIASGSQDATAKVWQAV